MDGIYAPGVHRLGPDNATLSVHTKRGGAAAKAGHDLELHVTRWEATLDLDAGTAELTADGSSLRVEKGEGGMQKLGRRGQGEHPQDHRRRGPGEAEHYVPFRALSPAMTAITGSTASSRCRARASR